MIRSAFASLIVLSLVACGGDPPAKTANDANDSAGDSTSSSSSSRRGGGGPTVGQELGSIDQRAVEKMTNNLLNGKLESCHRQARGRIDYLTGDVKMFFRIDGAGKVKYSYFEDSTMGDRDTEKCILDTFASADWPKPIGGEAEVRNGFGWTPGDERQPSPWEPEKVTSALDNPANKSVKDAVDKCKAGTSGFKVTAYVEPGEVESATPELETPPKGGKKPVKANAKAAKPEADGGKFKAIGMAVPNKEAAEKVDCIVDALKQLPLPSPGSYAAKVSFTL